MKNHDTDATLDRVRRILAKRRNVVEKRMIGGLCFMLDGSMCCGVNKGGLLLRVGADNLERTLKLRHVKPMKFGGRQLKGFVVVEPSGFRTDDALKKWIERGIQFSDRRAAK